MNFYVNEYIRLETASVQHAQQLFAAIDSSRLHLSAFLPWVDAMGSVADVTAYLKNCELLAGQGKEVSFVIFYHEVPAGRIGLHHISLENKSAAIGYWLTKQAQGHGVVTLSCKALIGHGFNALGLHRIEIKAAVENVRSQAIPQKLNFKQEGILREAEWVNGAFIDLVLYSLLREDWNEHNPVINNNDK